MLSDPIVIEYESSLLENKTRGVKDWGAAGPLKFNRRWLFHNVLPLKSWKKSCNDPMNETSSEEGGGMKGSTKGWLQEKSLLMGIFHWRSQQVNNT